MINLTREEAQQVLNALENFCEYGAILKPLEVRDLLRAKLSEPEPEPVAIVQQEAIGKGQVLWVTPASQVQDGTPLYTAPPQREELRRLHEVNAELVEAVKAALSDDQPYIERCKAALVIATGEQP